MASKKPKVTLFYDVSEERYYLTQIQGSVPAVDYTVISTKRLMARVGSVLSEDEVELLGRVADLTIKQYTV